MEHPWRKHPKLERRLHPDFPDDVQVIVHDGGPRMTDRRPEVVWVRIVGVEGDVFTGSVLNEPEQLATVKRDASVTFIVPDGGPHPLQVRDKYLKERADWTIHPCNQCGLSELFDAPSDLIRKVFPGTPDGAVMEMFTAFCGACGGAQVVQHITADARRSRGTADRRKRRWWQFWK